MQQNLGGKVSPRTSSITEPPMPMFEYRSIKEVLSEIPRKVGLQIRPFNIPLLETLVTSICAFPRELEILALMVRHYLEAHRCR